MYLSVASRDLSLREMFGAEGVVFDSYGPIHRTWASVMHFHVLPFGVFLFALALLAAEAIAGRLRLRQAEAHKRLFEVLVGDTGGFEADTAAAAAAASAAPAAAAAAGIAASRKAAETLQAGRNLSDSETHGLGIALAGDDPRDGPTPFEEEPLLFSQIFEALDLNPQDVSLWAKTLRDYLGEQEKQQATETRRHSAVYVHLKKGTGDARRQLQQRRCGVQTDQV